jgi:hypothetical protein
MNNNQKLLMVFNYCWKILGSGRGGVTMRVKVLCNKELLICRADLKLLNTSLGGGEWKHLKNEE